MIKISKEMSELMKRSIKETDNRFGELVSQYINDLEREVKINENFVAELKRKLKDYEDYIRKLKSSEKKGEI